METLADNTVTTRIPPQLIRSDTHGKGAAEIGWGTPGDFDRCRAFMRRHDVPGHEIDGACANLHKLATGEWPGKNAHKSHLAIAAVVSLTAALGPTFKGRRWSGPLAPIGTPTGDGRIFPPNTLKYQTFPMPLGWQEHSGRGHDGAVTVGVIEHAEERIHNGKPIVWGHGYLLDPKIIPEVTKAEHLIEHGVAGASVDLDSYTAALRPGENGKHLQTLKEGRMRSSTIVRIPAFADLRLQFDDDEPETVTAAIDGIEDFSVNGTGWKGAPVAPREAEFDADDAVSRIEAWAGQDRAQLDKMFLWVNPNGDALGRDGYKLPWGDIIDGKPYLIYHAVYAAAALLSGAHGGLPNIPDEDKARLRGVITQIYSHLASELDDPNIRAPWDRRPDNEQVTEAALVSAVGAILEEFRDMPGGKRQPRVPGVPGARRSRHIDNPHGGEFEDVPGRGPHGQVKVGNKWVYPAKGAKDPEASARAIAKKGGGKTVVAKKSDIDAEREADRKRAAHLRDVAAAGSHRPEPKEDKKPEPKPEKKAPEKAESSQERSRRVADEIDKEEAKSKAAKAEVQKHRDEQKAKRAATKKAAPAKEPEKKAPEPAKGQGHIAEQVRAAGTHDEGRTRQHHVDRARAVADMASAMDELDFNENTLDESKKRMASMAERYKGQPGGDDLAELNTKLQAAKTTAEMNRIAHQYAESHGLSRSGRAGQVTPFDRTKHQRIGSDDHRPGEKVEIIRPGYMLHDGDKDITLRRPIVDSAVPEVDAKQVEEKVDAAEAKDPKMTDDEKLKIRREVIGKMLEPEQKKVWDGLSDEQKDRIIDQTASAMREQKKNPGGRIAVVDAKTGKEVGGKTIVAKKEHKITPAQQKAIEALKADPNAKIHPATRKVLERENLIPKAEAQKPETAKPEKSAGRTVVAKGAGSDGVDDIRGKLDEVKTREEADRILAEVKGQRLKDLARSYHVSPNGPVADIRADIREHTVGNRRNSEAIRSGAKASDVKQSEGGKHPATKEGVRAAFHDVLKDQGVENEPGGSWVSVADIRDRLGGTREEQDAALRDFEQESDTNIVPQANQKALSQRSRDAAVRIGRQDKTHLTVIPGEKSSTEKPTASQAKPGSFEVNVGGKTFTRNSKRPLTHAVVKYNDDGSVYSVSWHESLAGAQREQKLYGTPKRIGKVDEFRGGKSDIVELPRAKEPGAETPTGKTIVAKTAPAKESQDVKEQWKKFDALTSRDRAREMVKDLPKRDLVALAEEGKVPHRKSDNAEQLRSTLVRWTGVKEDSNAILPGPTARKKPQTPPEAPAESSTAKKLESAPEVPGKPESVTGGRIDVSRRSPKPRMGNTWGGVQTKGQAYAHPDGVIPRGAASLGADGAIDVDGDRLDNALDQIATDTVLGRLTGDQQVKALRTLAGRLPDGSAKRRVESMANELDAPPRERPASAEGAPEPLRKLMDYMLQFPLARGGSDADRSRHTSYVDALDEVLKNWHEGRLGARRLIGELESKVYNRRHESAEGKVPIDRKVHQTIEELRAVLKEPGGPQKLMPPGKANAPRAARGTATVVAKGRAKVPAPAPSSGPTITGDHGDNWHHQLPPGDTNDDGVPVRDLKLPSGYVVRQGRMVRKNGTAYLIEDRPGQDHKNVVAFLDRFQSSLPHARTLQHGIAWLNGANPDDEYWAKRFGTEHTSAMTAGGGKVHVWGPGTEMRPVDTEFSLRHEYGHNVDGRGAALMAKVNSEGSAWRDAVGTDSQVSPPPGFVAHSVLGDGVNKEHGKGREVPDGVTEYGKSSLGEDFAESVMLYLQHAVGRVYTHGQHSRESLPVFFRELFPQRAALLDRVFPDIAEQQRAIQRARGPLPGPRKPS